ncbi:MAG: hypothetical protein L6Q78_15625 [Bacteroidia bacterium]|nr:hypothetical protein [Bacteroidia bacterium]
MHHILMILLFVAFIFLMSYQWTFPLGKRKGDEKVKPSHLPPSNSDWMDQLERSLRSRQDYYRNVYLKSDAWKRKRFVVLKRDNYTCVHCGAKATQVHHKRYAKNQIGKEPIHWLESVCGSCHDRLHGG